MDPNDTAPPAGDPGEAAGATLKPLHLRLIDVVFSPGVLAQRLAANPAWVGALLVVLALIVLQTSLIPAEVMMEAQREAMLERGQEAPEMPAGMAAAMRFIAPIFAVLAVTVFTFLFAGIYTFVFAFVLGDEGRYRQYLAITTHAWVIPTAVGLLLTPLKISTGDPQLTLNLASFMTFLPEGYWLGVLKALDLTQIWASLVIAQGAHAIDPKRSFASAATAMLTILLLFALVMGRFLA